MNQSHTPKPRATPAEALTWGDQTFEIETECAGIGEFAFTQEDKNRALALWLYLTDIEPGSPLAAVAVDEVQGCPDLIIKLQSPAMEFVEWFRRDEWHHSVLSNVRGKETDWGWGPVDWALSALGKACLMARNMGRAALQQPLSIPA